MAITAQVRQERSSRDAPLPRPEPQSKLLLTVVEAAQQLGIGRTLMYELLCSGQVESIHVGRLHRVPAEALTDFIARQRGHAASP